MAEESSRAFGRKVFFVCPNFAMKSILIPRLVENEYEAYIVEKYQDAKNVLRMYDESICFVCVDEEMTHEAWLNFLYSCENDETLKSISFASLSATIPRPLKKKYMDSLSLAAGFIPMNESIEDLYDLIENILKVNGAKGRRQYVRSSCAGDSNAIMLVQQNAKAYKLEMLDVSVAGAAVSIDMADKAAFAPNSVLRNTSVTLGTRSFAIDAVIYAVIQTENFCKLVLLFIQPVSPVVKQNIHAYIASSLKQEIDSIIMSSSPDNTDYAHLAISKE